MKTDATAWDVMVIGRGIAGAASALAVSHVLAGGRRSGPSIALLQDQSVEEPDTAAAGYTFLNPRVASLLPGVKSRLSRLTDGSFRGLVVIGASDGRRAEFRSRSMCGYAVDGPKLLRGLLALCRAAGIKIIRPGGSARFVAEDDRVLAIWPGGRCGGRVALLADCDVALSGRAAGLGFRQQGLINRMVRCCGMTFPVRPARLTAAFGASRPLVTVWQLHCLSSQGTANGIVAGPDAHAWVMPRRNSVAVGVSLGAPEADSAAWPGPDQLMDHVLGELRTLNVLPRELDRPAGPARSWRLPVAASLEMESHTAKRSLAVGLAGGFVAALSGQWLYPTVQAAALAGVVVGKALADGNPQDVLSQFGVRWRQKLAEYLRSPNTRLPFLLPLVFGNQQMTDRFARAYLFGENL